MLFLIPPGPMPIPQLTCPVCDSVVARHVPAYHDWIGVRWQLVRCGNCEHRYTHPIPTSLELESMYADAYFEAGGAWVCGFWSGGYVENEAKLRAEAVSTLSLLPAVGRRLLEIGAAGGFFLNEARAAGFEVTGVELNRTMAEWGRKHLGVPIICGAFETTQFVAESFDVIVAQDVIEHVRSPRAFVARVAQLLAPGGVLLVRGPLENSWREAFYLGLRRWRRHPFAVTETPPYHLQGFVRRSFRLLVEGAGLDLTRFEARSNRPRVEWSSAKGLVAGAIDVTALIADRLTAHGEFMVGLATRPKH